MKTCCVTGHRDIDENKLDYIKAELRREVLQAIDDGYTTFFSGFARGIDLFFADIIAELKSQYPITLIAALPHLDRLKVKDPEFKRLIKCCDSIDVCSEEYESDCFMKRNCFMVDNSYRVIAVYDNRKKGGTFATINYAKKHGREVRIIPA